MDLDDFRSILRNSGVDVWTFIETAISVASLDYGHEFKSRRDGLAARLYASTVPRCQNCDLGAATGSKRKEDEEEEQKEEEEEEEEQKEEEEEEAEDEEEEEERVTSRGIKGASPATLPSFSGAAQEEHHGYDLHPVDSEQERLLIIKGQLEDPDQSDESLVESMECLADMDITFKALKETDVGRQVNGLRKHPSGEVRRLAKQLVRKWKDLVDEWVKLNTPGEVGASSIVGNDSPLQQTPPQQTLPKPIQNGSTQVSDTPYSPNRIHGSDKNSNPESDSKIKKETVRGRRRRSRIRPLPCHQLSRNRRSAPWI